MKAWYPPLISAFIVLAIYSANLSITPPRDVIRPLLVTLVGTCLVWAFFRLVFRDIDRAAAASTSFVACVFSYTVFNKAFFSDPFYPYAGLIVWGLITIAILLVVSRIFRWHRQLNVFSSFLVLSSLASIGFGFAKMKADTAHIRQSALQGAMTSGVPDIYYIILDGHGREDSIRNFIGYDDSWFISALRDRGFFIADRSCSNYVQTELSIASSLNLELIPQLLPDIKPESQNRAPLDQLVDDSFLVQSLRARGYTDVAISTGFPAFTFDRSTLHLSHTPVSTLFESALLAMTPLAANSGTFSSIYNDRRAMLTEAFENLRELGSETGPPKVVVAHILAPHPPFVFDANGNPTRHHGSFGFADGSDYMRDIGKVSQYRAGYAAQCEFMDKQTLSAVDAILANKSDPPVIVIQGDHGSKSLLDQDDYMKTNVNECFPNLEAIYGPAAVKDKLYRTITPVNEFRVIFSALFGDKYDLLPDRSWYSPFEHPYEFTDATDRIKLGK